MRHSFTAIVARSVLAVALAAGSLVALGGCSAVPPNGTPIIRAVPPDGEGPMTVAGREGVIVLFKPGDRIALTLDVRGSIGHVEPASGGQELVIDREFLVWSGPRGASISFNDGRDWTPAERAIAGMFEVDWRRAPEAEGGEVNEVIVRVTASPR